MKELAEFGEISWIKSSRARNISVKIMSDGLRVVIPDNYSVNDALRFIQLEYDKIRFKQKKIQERSQKHLLTEGRQFKTATFNVNIIRAKRNDVFFVLKQGILDVEIPFDVEFESKKIQQACWNGINYFLKKEAKRMLPQRVHELAEKFGFKYRDVKIQSSKTRWGSCSVKKNINLSYFLMLMPGDLSDYVILHELCHTIEMNHGEKFWALMSKVTEGKAHEMRNALKKYQIPDY